MEKTMLALVLCGRGETQLREVPVPTIGEEDILLEVKACGICGSDLHYFFGHQSPNLPRPYIIGHEFAGVIAAMGKNVTDYWHVGDRVVSENTGYACGRCPACAKGNFVACPERRTLGGRMDGGFTKYVRIPGAILRLNPNCLFRIPDNLSFAEATVLEPAANAYNALIQQGGFQSGENVLVYGAGAMGLMAIQQAVLAGACKAILVGWSNARKVRFDVARKYGATHLFLGSVEQNIEEQVAEICGEMGVAVVIDAAGHPSVTEEAIRIVRNEGAIVRAGLSFEEYNRPLNDFPRKNISIIGHKGYNTQSWRNSINLAQCGRLDLKTIITHELPLTRYREGFEAMNSSDAAKVVLIP